MTKSLTFTIPEYFNTKSFTIPDLPFKIHLGKKVEIQAKLPPAERFKIQSAFVIQMKK